jgi:hypothetical protein
MSNKLNETIIAIENLSNVTGGWSMGRSAVLPSDATPPSTVWNKLENQNGMNGACGMVLDANGSAVSTGRDCAPIRSFQGR